MFRDSSVFLSYRRSDTSGHAGRISDDLERHFKGPVVFRDVDSIGVGADFVKALESAIAGARVVLVLIGDEWLAARSPDGSRRLDAPDDHVRSEVEMALQAADATVIPVLVTGAEMPGEADLPPPLKPLARLQAISLSEDRWNFDVSRLVRVLEQAGIEPDTRRGLPAWAIAVMALSLVSLAAVILLCFWQGRPGIDQYTGLWHMPNGGYWTITERDGGLWVDETHRESGEVWKRGPAVLEAEGLIVDLDPVFDKVDFRYRHTLKLSDDRHSLIGSHRRTDRQSVQSLVLTRNRP